MKKIFILATAAIVAFASCMKSEVVYNQEPQEIAFRQFTGSMTKAEAFPDSYSMGIYAYLAGTDKAYFTNAEFEKKSSGKWGGKSMSYYWPLQGNLDFTVYAPYQNTDVYAFDTKKLSVSIADNSSAQIDYLYGKVLYKDTPKPATPSEGVAVVLKHALSKVTINVKSDATGVFKVKKISLLNTKQEGSYTVTYSDSDNHTSTVDAAGADHNIEYFSGDDAVTSTGSAYSKLVVPSEQTKIEIQYTMEPSTTVLIATIDLAAATTPAPKWETGKHYTYNITLNADEILFTPSVDDWGPVTEPSELYNHTIGE